MKLEKTLVILSIGRTGSTLLRSILNQTIEDSFIQGENFHCTWWLYEFYKSITNEKYDKSFRRYNDEKNPFYRRVCLEDVQLHFKRLLRRSIRLDEDIRVCGFKEIRWQQFSKGNISEIVNYFNFLNQYFPNIKIIVSIRDAQELSQSAWFKENNTPVSKIESRQNFLLQIDENETFQTIVVDYKDLISNNLEYLFTFLGEPYQKEVINEILNSKHSF